MIDDRIRYPNDPPPVMPWLQGHRYRWPEPNRADDVRRLREHVQEDARGLYVLQRIDGVTVIVEAYYPEDIRDQFYRGSLDRWRRADYQMGRLVVVHELFALNDGGRVEPEHLAILRRNNRNARRHLRRNAPASYRKQELQNTLDAEDEEVIERAAERAGHAAVETRKILQPHIYT